ncbi:alpha-ketoglutarate-dependent dioxygenase AlkB [Flavobacterium sp.]|uniref:alpha-ketoglutarate-dependent dioxygenase AlkB family protein n=1 Tax=Flavobacterium sp. TaxID=239 RepID=UPI002617FDE8|nr:alpha-ketoglutarate-dependent dioxygenase AlkB [Flavobacterium sp.]MDD3003645.1 alpha-ketoglutarate-dependent dioxygenase AlkB [Flavobacterium sp.]
MDSLFSQDKIHLSLPDAEIIYIPRFFKEKEADEWFNYLLQNIAWQQDSIKIFGKSHLQPRLTAFYGAENLNYSYSNLKMEAHSWSPELINLKNKVEQISDCTFNSVLLNLYRDGKDSNGWHADDEKELGKNPVIASLTLGSERFFHLKHNHLPAVKSKIKLENGSLLLMKGTTQHFYKHQIPKTQQMISPRINLTFRTIKEIKNLL